MNFKQRLRRLERIAHDRLAAATAEVALSVLESPPLTETEARRLDLAELLRSIEVELHPAKVRESADFGRYCRNYRRVPLLKLYGYYLALKQRHRKIQSRRRRGTFPKGSIEYYRFLCRIYNERTEQASRLEREAMYAQREASHQDAAPIPATSAESPTKTAPELPPLAPQRLQVQWAVA